MRGHPSTIVRAELTRAGITVLPKLGAHGQGPWTANVVTVHNDDGTADTHVAPSVHEDAPETTEQLVIAVKGIAERYQLTYWDNDGVPVLLWPRTKNRTYPQN